jgi:predicted DNA-binding transcriptional regulator AlpA
MPENMRPGDAAAYLTVSVQRLAKMRLTGNSPPFCRLGRSIVYRKADIDSWLEAKKRISTSDTR